jgi:hypothetical protein
MAAVLSDHQPIRVVQTISGNSAFSQEIPEQSAQTFLEGVPVMLNSGFIKEWDAVVPAAGAASATSGIAGIARAPGSNLGSSGAGAPTAFTGVGAPAAAPTFGKVLNQPSAINFTPGAPFVTGRTPFEVASPDTVFEATFDSADGSTVNATTNVNMIGKPFGLTKDTTGHWYVDAQKVTAGTNTVVKIKQLSPLDGAIQNGRVWFVFETNCMQIGGI